jgi:hypothetical protein
MLQIADLVTAVDLENASAAQVAESVFAELTLDINPNKLQGNVSEVDRDRGR